MLNLGPHFFFHSFVCLFFRKPFPQVHMLQAPLTPEFPQDPLCLPVYPHLVYTLTVSVQQVVVFKLFCLLSCQPYVLACHTPFKRTFHYLLLTIIYEQYLLLIHRYLLRESLIAQSKVSFPSFLIFTTSPVLFSYRLPASDFCWFTFLLTAPTFLSRSSVYESSVGQGYIHSAQNSVWNLQCTHWVFVE